MSERLCEAAGCGKLIRFVLTEAGTSMPLDIDPNPDGTVVAITQPDGSVRARVLTGRELPAQQTAWRSHFATCPGSDVFRARKARQQKRCGRTGCTTPLDDVLVALGLSMHPNCEDGTPPSRTRPAVAVIGRGEAPPAAAGPTSEATPAPVHEQLDLLGGES